MLLDIIHNPELSCILLFTFAVLEWSCAYLILNNNACAIDLWNHESECVSIIVERNISVQISDCLYMIIGSTRFNGARETVYSFG